MAIIRPARPADAKHIAELHVSSWKETYGDIIPKPYLDALDINKRSFMWRKSIEEGNFVSVAEEDNKIVGFTSGGKFRGDDTKIHGELYAIYVLGAYHNRGIGKGLFNDTKEFLFQSRLFPFALWVLEENPSCGFYESLGGRIYKEALEGIGGKSFKKLLFVFE